MCFVLPSLLMTTLVGLSLGILLPSEHYALMRLYESLGMCIDHCNIASGESMTHASFYTGCSSCERFAPSSECTLDVEYVRCEQESVIEVCVNPPRREQPKKIVIDSNCHSVAPSNLPDSSLTGSLPTELGILTGLRRLYDVRCLLVALIASVRQDFDE
jgi:hypothetical protein